MKTISWELNFLEKALNKTKLNANIEQHSEKTFTISLDELKKFLFVGNFKETHNFIISL